MNCILIADSGSTKTDWLLTSQAHDILEVHTAGINPVRDSQDVIFRILSEQLMPQLMPHVASVGSIFFYGSGCVEPFSDSVREALGRHFPEATAAVESDLLGAARALCGHQPGIACILGTGSNTCYFDGSHIALHTPPLGYILGDEGSGATLGRTLLNRLLKGALPQQMKDELLTRYNLTPASILDRVYKQPQANVFLASLVPFITEHRSHPQIRRMLHEAFTDFVVRNILPYGHPELPLHFVGSIAAIYREELQAAIEEQGLRMGRIVQKPLHAIAQYHTTLHEAAV